MEVCMARRSRSLVSVSLVLGLALAQPALDASRAEAQRVEVRPPRRGGGGGGGGGRGGAVVVTPEAPRRGGGAVVVTPEAPRRGGAVVVTPDAPRRGGAVVVEPPRRGGAVVVSPEPPRGGAVVVEPPRRGGAVVVEPPRRGGAVVVEPPRRGGAVVVAPQPPRGGVVVVEPPRRGGGVVVARRPPPVRVVVPQPPRRTTRWRPPTSPGEMWIEGHWAWGGADWQWVDGHWELPPQPGAIWIAPTTDGGGWVPGYWTMPSYPGPVAGAVRPYQIGAYVSGQLSGNDPMDAGGGYYHDYALALSAGETATLLAVAGPSDQYAGQRLAVGLQLVWNGAVIASDQTMPGSMDARLAFTAGQAGVYTVRVRSRGGPYATGTYVLESAPGNWMPEVNPYDQLWGGGGGVVVQPQPQQPPVQPGWGGVGGPGQAIAISIGSQVSSLLEPGDRVDETGGQYDEIVVNAAPGETFTVVARGTTSMSGRSTIDVFLRAFSDGIEVAQDDDSAGGRNARVIVTAPRSGQVVLRVGTWRGSMERMGYYELLVLPGAQPYAQ
ncbi:16S rRNA processing protein RimM [Sandaracinus amylolyticus]|uniref:16S rRNA processing protein RimM n=2 Tax=Sandaracinus amylolyticus TaxID=927083 RepID=A0A0F6SGV4_9BACT|nr:16S rRNA processing protein RimM [Sandaracinus amylolyticus]